MEKKTESLIKTLTELQSTSGHERNVREFMRKEMEPLVDRIEQDGLGGIFGVREHQDANAPKIMIAAHMDEVGFMVTNITSTGLLKVSPLGGWNPYVVSAQRFTLQTRKGDYPVISSSIPPHLLRAAGGQQAAVKVTDILFDAGFTSKEEAEEYGVRPGDTIVPLVETIWTANKKRMIAKSWDNRYGCTVVLEALRELKNEVLPNTLIAGANVQEEVGLRGAHVSTTKFDPEVFFAVDCSPAGDIYGNQGKVGDGTLIRFFDPGHIMLPNMKDFLLTTAEEAGIKYQYYCAAGGTDAGAAHLQNAGVPSTTIGVCARYIHSHQTLYAMDDFLEAQAFLQAIVKKLDRSTVDLIKNY